MADQTGPIAYLDRIRRYYQGLGYGKPYQWARYDEVPFSRLQKPVEDSRLMIVTTAAPFQPGRGDQGPGATYNGNAKFFQVYTQPVRPEPDLRISHIAIDRDHTTAEDQGSYFPLRAFHSLVGDGLLGSVADVFCGLPTNRSQRTTVETDAPAVVAASRQAGADLAVLVANCPVCHQSITLAARALEESGIPTVVMGCALDIVEHVGAPRFLFSDFPLGNAAGLPGEPSSQRQTAELALQLFKQASGPQTTMQSPQVWPGPADWRLDYSNIDNLSEAEIAERRAEFDRGKQNARRQREGG